MMRSLLYRSQSTLEHVWYVRNLFAMLQYAPDLRTEVLSTTVDRLLQIDVRAAWWPRWKERRLTVRALNPGLSLAAFQTELQEADIVLSATDEDEADGPDGEPLMFDVEMDVRAHSRHGCFHTAWGHSIRVISYSRGRDAAGRRRWHGWRRA